ncbi:MAG TPA: hypothetical protein VN457_08335, partial [Chlamydiales bacterium]|nr:hypothetical protein [Chlamydiales bacterium]
LAQELQQGAQKKRAEEEALRAAEQAKIKKKFDEANAKLKGAGKQFKKAYDGLIESTTAAVKGVKKKAGDLQKSVKNSAQTLQKAVTDTVKDASKSIPEALATTRGKTGKAYSSLITTVIEIGREFRKVSGKSAISDVVIKTTHASMKKQLAAAKKEIESEFSKQKAAIDKHHRLPIIGVGLGKLVGSLISQQTAALITILKANPPKTGIESADGAIKQLLSDQSELLQKVVEVNLLRLANNFFTTPGKINDLKAMLTDLASAKTFDAAKQRLSAYFLVIMNTLVPHKEKEFYLPPQFPLGKLLTTSLITLGEKEIKKPGNMEKIIQELVVPPSTRIAQMAGQLVSAPKKVTGAITFFQWLGNLFANLFVIIAVSTTGVKKPLGKAIENLQYLQTKEKFLEEVDLIHKQVAPLQGSSAVVRQGVPALRKPD